MHIPAPYGLRSYLVLPGTDWLYQFTNEPHCADDCKRWCAHEPSAYTVLSFIALMQLVSMVINFSTANMAFSLNHEPRWKPGRSCKFLLRLGLLLPARDLLGRTRFRV